MHVSLTRKQELKVVQNKYHLFAGYNYYPEQGLNNYVKSFDSIEEAFAYKTQFKYDWKVVIYETPDGLAEVYNV